MVAFETLLYSTDEGIATLTINRPEKLNALSTGTIREIGAGITEALGDSTVQGVILTGSGDKAFVAGADISELASMTPLEGARLSRAGQAVFRAIELAQKPVIAAVNGFALGGGCELALACHIRIAAEGARFGLPEVKLGVIPGYGGTVRLPRIVGKGRALEMILTGEMVDAAEAYRIGLVNRVVPLDRLISEARAMLGGILQNGPLALGFAIESVTRGEEMSAENALAFEAHLFGLLAATDDLREGMHAFLEKRKADFRGR